MSGYGHRERRSSLHILAVLAGAAGLFVGFVGSEVLGIDLDGGAAPAPTPAPVPAPLAEASRADLCGELASRVEEGADSLGRLTACLDLFAAGAQ